MFFNIIIFSYSRMPGDLLPKVIMSLHARIKEGFPFKNDKTGLLVCAFFSSFFSVFVVLVYDKFPLAKSWDLDEF